MKPLSFIQLGHQNLEQEFHKLQSNTQLLRATKAHSEARFYCILLYLSWLTKNSY